MKKKEINSKKKIINKHRKIHGENKPEFEECK